MSRIDPAEFDRLARRKNDAQKEYYDAIVKQKEAVVNTRSKEEAYAQAHKDLADYVSQHLPPEPPPPPGVEVIRDPDPRQPAKRDKLGAMVRDQYAQTTCCEVWARSRVWHDANCGPMNRAYEISEPRLRHGERG